MSYRKQDIYVLLFQRWPFHFSQQRPACCLAEIFLGAMFKDVRGLCLASIWDDIRSRFRMDWYIVMINASLTVVTPGSEQSIAIIIYILHKHQ